MIKDTALAFLKANPVIPANEMAFERDTGIFKYGNGESQYNNLPIAGRDVAEFSPVVAPVAADAGKVWTAVSEGVAGFYPGTGGTASVGEYDVKNPPAPLAACVGNGATNDTTAFRAILAKAATDKKGVYIPAGTYMLDAGNALAGCAGVIIRGQGPGQTILKMRTTQNANFFTLYGADDSAMGCGITNLTLDGNKDQNTGTGWAVLHISSVNHMTYFKHFVIQHGYDGLKIDNSGGGTYQWVYLFDDLLLRWSKRSDLRGLGTDNMFSNLMLGGAETDDCIYATGANCRMHNIKIMGSKGKNGLGIVGSRLQFENIDSQENFLHGVMFYSTSNGCVINNLNTDNNGMDWATIGTPKAVPDGYGIYYENGCQDIAVMGHCFSNRDAGIKYAVAPFYAVNGAVNITHQLIQNKNPAGASVDLTATGVDLLTQNKGHREISGNITLTFADVGRCIINNSANNVIVTIPLVAAAPEIRIGRPIDTTFERRSTGTITFAIGGGGAINSIGSVVTCRQNGRVTLKRTPVANDMWFLTGDLGT